MQTRSASKLSLTPFMGIALADILANGVAIIMLLIVITISSKYQLEQEKLEQIDEVSRVLSRDIISSVVMNNLAASPPAVLHDYVDSQSDRDLRHAVMPILELRDASIRDYYNGRSWSREQLLHQDNSFDAYLSTLNENQRLLLRTDIYEVDMFYIYMSILKDHDLIPRHWHFAVKTSGQGQVVTSVGDTDSWSKFFDQEELGSNEGMGEYLRPGQQGTTTSGYQGLEDGNYPWDVMSTNEGDSEETTGPGTVQGSPIRFRLASPDTQLQFGQLSFELDNDQQDILAGLLSYLQLIDTELEKHRPVLKILQDMPNYLQQFMKAPRNLSEYEQRAIENITQVRLAQALVGTLSDADYLSIEYRQQDNIRGLAANLPVNQALGKLAILADDSQAEYFAMLPKYGNAHLHLQHYPELLQGLSLELEPGSIVLAADYAVSDAWRWYPIFFIYPEFNDFVMGFIYASVPAPGQMLIAAESNRLTVAGYSLHLARDNERGESEYLLVFIFGGILAALLLIYAALLWRRNTLVTTT